MFLHRPRLKAYYRAEHVGDDAVLLLAEDHYAVIEGQVPCWLLTQLDGSRTIQAILAALSEPTRQPEVLYVLRQLYKDGYVEEGGSPLPPAEAAYWALDRTDAPSASPLSLVSASIQVDAFDVDEVESFARLLADLHISQVTKAPHAVVLTDDYLHPALEAYSRAALADGKTWMLVKPVGRVIWMGPIFQPDAPPCWSCLATRVRENRRAEHFIQTYQNQDALPKPPVAALPSTIQTALAMAATEVARWLFTPAKSQLNATLLTLDTQTLALDRHAVVAQPHCPVCGTPPSPPEPIALRPSAKHYCLDGGHRVTSPTITFERFKKHISPITGVIRSLSPYTFPHSDPPLHAYYVAHTMARQIDTLGSFRENERARSAGKGMSAEQARTSGLCEALERYSGVFRGDEPQILGTYRALRNAAIHPYDCLLFSETQYQERTTWNAATAVGYQRVPEPFDEHEAIAWSPVYSLTHGTFRYIPTRYAYYNFNQGPAFCSADSNGNAAGNTLEEAILQGLLEVIERDAVAIWWYNRLPRPSVDLDSFADPQLQAMRTTYAAHQRALWVLDITSDLGVPTFAAISPRTDRQPEDILMGFGCHLDPRIAVRRAITEVTQLLPAVLHETAAQTTAYHGLDALAMHWFKTASLKQHPYLQPDTTQPARVATEYPHTWSNDLKTDIETWVARLHAQNLEVLVLDQTRPDIGLPVVKVVVPGLRHFWKRLAPGRLYTVPVDMGWLPTLKTETQMNPFPMFL